MKIFSLEVTKKGVQVHFNSERQIDIDTYLQVMFEDKPHYFQVTQLAVFRPTVFIIHAAEVGCWAKKFTRLVGMQFSDLLGLPVEIVEDELTIKTIEKQSLWT